MVDGEGGKEKERDQRSTISEGRMEIWKDKKKHETTWIWERQLGLGMGSYVGKNRAKTMCTPEDNMLCLKCVVR